MTRVLLFCATVLLGRVVASEETQTENGDVAETSEELIQDFVTVVRLLDDVAKTYEEERNDTNQSNEVVYPMLTLAKYVTEQVDSSAPKVKDFFNKALKVKADIHDKETEAEAEEMRKLINGLDQSEKKEVKKLREEYEAKADKLGLEDLLLSIKDEA